MSHQSGICANEKLKHVLAQAKNGQDRLIKVIIENEELRLDATVRPQYSWDKDFDSLVPKLVQDNQACYILFRLDSKNSLGHDWVFITYAPDTSPVRQRMLYAATRATLKSEFGQVYIKEELQASTKEDLTSNSLALNRNPSEPEPLPLSSIEEDLRNAKISESNPNDLRSITVNQTLRGVAFPVDQEALEKLQSLKNGEINYVQLSVDTLNEAIKLEKFDTIQAKQFQSFVPRQKARYHFYVYEHNFDGNLIQSTLFLYTLPPSGYCPVKEKMLYSSCKAPFLDTVQRHVGLQIDRKLEVDSGDDINEQFLFDELHPKHVSNQISFAKPQGPRQQRGQRRINKPSEES